MAASDDPRAVPAPANDGVTDERKERVLHTRVPDSLDRQLKRRARSLGMSVSTIVRHVLLNTFGLVEDIVSDGTNLAFAITGEEAAGRAEADRAKGNVAAGGEILAWQDAVLNVNAVCEHCNEILRRGTHAAIGVREQPGPRVIICRRCLERVENGRGAARRRK
jgi:hypothetical protein